MKHFKPSFQGLVLLLAYYLLVLAITLLASTVSSTSVVSCGLAIGGVLLLSLLPLCTNGSPAIHQVH